MITDKIILTQIILTFACGTAAPLIKGRDFLAGDKKQAASPNLLLVEARALLQQQKFVEAVAVLKNAIKREPNHSEPLILLARCYLGLGRREEAMAIYRSLLAPSFKATLSARGEAELLLGNFYQALQHFDSAQKHNSIDEETYFLAAVAAYLAGHMGRAFGYLRQVARRGFEWEDDNPLDLVIQHLLRTFDYQDFEQIYLDAMEAVEQNRANPQNRWFSLSMPVYETLIASSNEKQKESALFLAERLDSEGHEGALEQGDRELQNILKDFARNESDARFGLEALKLAEEKKYGQVAGLILGLQLEHLKQFAPYFDLGAETIVGSSLQNLVPLLPQRMALALMLLYSASEPQDKIAQIVSQKMDPNLMAGLIALSFKAFYLEVKRYSAGHSLRSIESKANSGIS